MKTAYIAILVSIVVVAIVFAIPVIPIPVQRNETYTENITKQEPYTVIEKQQVSTPHIIRLFESRREFTDMNKAWLLCFKVTAPEVLPQVCDCDSTYNYIGTTKQGNTPFICVPDNGKIHVSWLVNENDRGTSQTDLSCPLHIGFTPYPSEQDTKYYGTDKRDWLGEIEFVPNGLPPAAFGYTGEVAKIYYANKRFNVFLRFGYDCGFIGKMPPVNLNVDFISYTHEIVDEEVTKYRDVPVTVEKQRTVIDYQKISVWQRIFSK